MSEIIVFVDDLPLKVSYNTTGYICRAISKISQMQKQQIRCILICGQEPLISESLPLVKEAINNQVDPLNDLVLGICVDLVDDGDKPSKNEQGKLVHSGEKLLERIKEDPDLEGFKVVIYTSRYPDVTEDELIAKGAVGLVKREDTLEEGKSVYRAMAERILSLL